MLFAGVEKGEEVEGDGENERERGREENESLREENTTTHKIIKLQMSLSTGPIDSKLF